jgi:hypothetical protein
MVRTVREPEKFSAVDHKRLILELAPKSRRPPQRCGMGQPRLQPAHFDRTIT